MQEEITSLPEVEAAAHAPETDIGPPTEEQIRHALAIAQKRQRVNGPAMFRRCRAAFHSGKRAKRMDWQRVSTAYCDALADEFFFDGYDGVFWEDAVKRLIG